MTRYVERKQGCNAKLDNNVPINNTIVYIASSILTTFNAYKLCCTFVQKNMSYMVWLAQSRKVYRRGMYTK